MTVVLHKLFSTLLMHFFNFFIEDEERAAVNYERKLGKEALGEVGGEGGWVGNDRSKGVYPEEEILIAASSNGERDEPSLQCNPAGSSMRFTVPDGATSFVKFKIKSCLKDVKFGDF